MMFALLEKIRSGHVAPALVLALLAAGCASVGTEPAAPAAMIEAPRPLEVPQVHQVVGLKADGLRRYFGEPTLLRTEADAELWQYAVEGCVLLLFLYEDAEGAPSVAHFESRPAGGRVAEENLEAQMANCLAEVARIGQRGPSRPTS